MAETQTQNCKNSKQVSILSQYFELGEKSLICEIKSRDYIVFIFHSVVKTTSIDDSE